MKRLKNNHFDAPSVQRAWTWDVLLHHKNKSFHPISRITWILARLHLHDPKEQQVTNSPLPPKLSPRGPDTFSPAFGLLPSYALRVQQQLLVLAFTQLPLPLWKTLRASWRDCTCASLPLYSPVLARQGRVISLQSGDAFPSICNFICNLLKQIRSPFIFSKKHQVREHSFKGHLSICPSVHHKL